MKRGLKGFSRDRNMGWSTNTGPLEQELVESNSPKGFRFIDHKTLSVRRSLVKEEDRQLADLSISHDGDYAVAVCMAVGEEYEADSTVLVDNGEGDPIHEPEWGDKGFGCG